MSRAKRVIKHFLDVAIHEDDEDVRTVDADTPEIENPKKEKNTKRAEDHELCLPTLRRGGGEKQA